ACRAATRDVGRPHGARGGGRRPGRAELRDGPGAGAAVRGVAGLAAGVGASSPSSLILPAVVVGLGAAAGLTRILRSALLEELGRDYVRTARAKGVSDRA